MEIIPNIGIPKVAKKEPASFTPEPGKIYSWCTCGLSGEQPFCDGIHKRLEHIINEQGESVLPYRSLKFQCERAEEVSLCQCKKTRTPPYCDESHKTCNRTDGDLS